MNSKKKWIIFGLTGAVGLSVIAGGAAATAASMELRTDDGTEIPGVDVPKGKTVLDDKGVTLRVSDDGAASVVTADSIASTASAPTAASAAAVSAPTAASVADVSAPSVVTPDSPASVPSPASVDTPQSPASVPSVPSAESN